MKVHSASSLRAAYIERHPNAGTIDALSASAEPGSLDEVHAMGVKGFSTVTGPLQWVKCTEAFYEAGDTINVGDYVEMAKSAAYGVVAAGRAVLSSAEEAASAAAAESAKDSK